MITRALVIGYGSIGARHARVLKELGIQVAVVSRHVADTSGAATFTDLADGLRYFAPDYVIVANETASHRRTVASLETVGFAGPILVEKPLMAHADEADALSGDNVRVAYNLRFHPVLQALASRLANERVLSVQIYTGQYLPDWRPGTDYRRSYSASRAAGGGVLRDLSHELDYMAWLFGPWRRLAALGGKRSALEIDSDDAWSILMETADGSMLTLQLNYLDRVGRREIVVVGAEHGYRADLVAGTLEVDKVSEQFTVERDTTYIEQHRAVLGGRWQELCSWDEGVAVMKTIANIERAAESQTWVIQ